MRQFVPQRKEGDDVSGAISAHRGLLTRSVAAEGGAKEGLGGAYGGGEGEGG